MASKRADWIVSKGTIRPAVLAAESMNVLLKSCRPRTYNVLILSSGQDRRWDRNVFDTRDADSRRAPCAYLGMS